MTARDGRKELAIKRLRAKYHAPVSEMVDTALRKLQADGLSLDCLRPHELESYWSTGLLPEDRLLHVESCGFCARVLPEIRLDEERLRLLVSQAVAAAAEAGGIRDSSESPLPPDLERPAVVPGAGRRPTNKEVFEEVVADSFGPGVLFLASLSFLVPTFGIPIFGLVGLASLVGAVLVGLAVLWLARKRGLNERSPVLYHSLPALAASAVFVLLLWPVENVVKRERVLQADKNEKAFEVKAGEYAKTRLAEHVVDSITSKAQVGEFRELPRQSGPFTTTSRVSKQHATYEQETAGLSGKLVAEVEPTGYDLVGTTPKGEEVERQQASVTLGEVVLEKPDVGKFSVRDSDGKTITLQAKTGLLPSSGSYVAVAYDTKTKTTLSVRELRPPSPAPTASPSGRE